MQSLLLQGLFEAPTENIQDTCVSLIPPWGNRETAGAHLFSPTLRKQKQLVHTLSVPPWGNRETACAPFQSLLGETGKQLVHILFESHPIVRSSHGFNADLSP